MKNKKLFFKSLFSSLLILTYPLIYTLIPGQSVNSAALTALSDTMTRQKVSVLSSHTIQFTLGASTSFDATETITVDFDEDGGGLIAAGSTDATIDYDFNDGTERTVVDVDGDCTGHSGTNDVVASLNDTTGVLTITACGTMTSSSTNATVTIEIGTAAGGTNIITNPVTPAAYSIAIVAAGDSGTLNVPVLSNDQVTITASISPSLSVDISSSSCVLGVLTTTTIQTCTYTLTVTTNSSGGYIGTILDDGNLRSPATDDVDDVGVDEIIDAADIEEYGVSTSSTYGSNDIVTYTDCNDGATTGDNQEATAITTSPQILAGSAGVVNGQVNAICHAAAIDTGTQAGEYSHIATIIVTATY